MPTCFVIQPFDAGPYDKRYDDAFVPAISDAGLEPYRVDRPETAMAWLSRNQSRLVLQVRSEQR